MYVWLAADLDAQLGCLRAAAQRIGMPNPALTLPLHVSLRISFPVEDAAFARVADRIAAYYGTLAPFTVHPQGIERRDRVVWLKIAESDTLAAIHRDLVELLRDEFAVPAHPFDDAFMYHASLFIGDEAENAFAVLQKEPYPQELHVTKLLIGVSATGRAGEYRVRREYPLTPLRTP